MLPHAARRGFTLLEISIVLLIIALLAAVITVGRDLIRIGHVRAVIRQVEQLDTAVSTFRRKYDCLPGDCVTASDNGFATVYHSGVSVNGDGDGLIRASNGESYQAVGELAEMGLLADVKIHPSCCKALYITLPTYDNANLYPGIIDIDYFWPDTTNHSSISIEGHYYWMRGAPYLVTSGSTNVLLPNDAYAIDSKMDDGLPRSGKVLSTGQVALGNNAFGDFPQFNVATDVGAAGATSNYCVTNATPGQYNTYNVSHASGSVCTMTIQAGF